MYVRVIVGPGLTADLGLVEEIVTAEFGVLGVPGRLVATADLAEFTSALLEADRDDRCAVVVMSGPEEKRPVRTPSRAVWFDPALTGPVDGHHLYLYGRGLWGLSWAVRHAVYRLRSPARRVWYGPHADQWGDLRLPAAPQPGGWPVAVLLHGGYWRSQWGADLMDAVAIDLVARGFATWNLEYRRPDLHGWPATADDVAAGVAVLTSSATPFEPRPGSPADATRNRALVREEVSTRAEVVQQLQAGLDPDRIAVIGHSAGGQLALRLVADSGKTRDPRKTSEPAKTPEPGRAGDSGRAHGSGRAAGASGVAVAVSLAGVVDLAEGARRGLSNGAVTAALGASAAQRPASDPMARLPIGVPLLIVQGRQDDLDLIDINRRFVRAARAAGDDVTYLEQPGDHFAVIDPASPLWQATAAQLTRRLRPTPDPEARPTPDPEARATPDPEARPTPRLDGEAGPGGQANPRP